MLPLLANKDEYKAHAWL